MAKADKCPYCSSRDIKRTENGWIAEGMGVAANIGLGLVLGMVGLHGKKYGRETMKTEYICNRCHKLWKTTEDPNGKINVHYD